MGSNGGRNGSVTGRPGSKSDGLLGACWPAKEADKGESDAAAAAATTASEADGGGNTSAAGGKTGGATSGGELPTPQETGGRRPEKQKFEGVQVRCGRKQPPALLCAHGHSWQALPHQLARVTGGTALSRCGLLCRCATATSSRLRT